MSSLLYFGTFLSIVFGIFTLYTFSRSSFIQLNANNIQLLLIINISIICLLIFLIIRKLTVFFYKSKEITGLRTNLNFIKYFIFVTAIPSIFVAVFSLMLFNLGIEKWFDKKVNDVVKNPYFLFFPNLRPAVKEAQNKTLDLLLP